VGTNGSHILYLTWFVAEKVEADYQFARSLAEKLPGETVSILVSVRDLRKEFKVSVYAELDEAFVPVVAVPLQGDPEARDAEYGELIDFFGGKKCLDVNLIGFQVVYSTEYHRLCHERLNREDRHAWTMMLSSDRLGPVTCEDCLFLRSP